MSAPKRVQAYGDVLLDAGGEPVFSLWLSQEEVELIAQGAVSVQMVAHAHKMLRWAKESEEAFNAALARGSKEETPDAGISKGNKRGKTAIEVPGVTPRA